MPMWLRSLWVRIAVGLVLGGAIGLVVHEAVRLKGLSLFVLCGAIAGVLIAVAFHLLSRNIELVGLTIGVPQFGRMHFVVTEHSQQVAWKLFVESVTRIATHPLEPQTGVVREALTSLHGLFATTRDILKESQPSRPPATGQTVEYLAITMLNAELHPFLSRWHPELRAWEQANHNANERDWPQDAECRAALEKLRRNLLEYARGFGTLARVPHADAIVDRPTAQNVNGGVSRDSSS